MAHNSRQGRPVFSVRRFLAVTLVHALLGAVLIGNMAWAGDGDSSYGKGREALRLGDTGAAERAFHRALYKEPGHREAQLALVDLYIAQQRYEEAHAIIDRRVAEGGPDGQLLLRKGLMYDQAGRPQDASRAYLSAIDLLPDDPDALAQAAGFFNTRGDRTRAETLTERRKRVLGITTNQQPNQ
ncbi:MAG: tetratricopeptide repeat protein [Gammaproteobacteria bacterium]|nr:tetratricopeptide repeat protein [Gammaproteobacteria bacterium]